MVYRKGEFQFSTLDRFYPYHLAVPLTAWERLGYRNRYDYVGALDALYMTLSDAPRHHSIGRGETEHCVYGFTSEAAAQALQEKFGGFRIEPTAKARRAAEERLRAQAEEAARSA
jgi:hypothetical protein